MCTIVYEVACPKMDVDIDRWPTLVHAIRFLTLCNIGSALEIALASRPRQ